MIVEENILVFFRNNDLNKCSIEPGYESAWCFWLVPRYFQWIQAPAISFLDVFFVAFVRFVVKSFLILNLPMPVSSCSLRDCAAAVQKTEKIILVSCIIFENNDLQIKQSSARRILRIKGLAFNPPKTISGHDSESVAFGCG